MGSAKEIFLGYLFLFGFFVLYQVAQLIIAQLPEPLTLVNLLLFPLIIAFFYKIKLGSFKYQSNRLALQGIRLSTENSDTKEQIILAIKLSFITILTLGLAYPYCVSRILEFNYSSLRFGGQKFSYSGSSRLLRKIYFKQVLIFLPFFIVLVSVPFILKDNPVLMEQVVRALTVLTAIFMIALQTKLSLDLFKYKVANLSHDSIQMKSDLKFSQVIKHGIINGLIVICSFGIATPVAIARNMKIYLQSIDVEGFEELEVYNDVKQSDPITSIDSAMDSFDLSIVDAF